jgi:PAS domain S-box-containing protein
MPTPENELKRLEALKYYNILDTVNEKDFDRFTELASIICEVPISLISLLDETRQWFKSKVGLDVNETSRSLAFCQHTIMNDNLFEVPDASIDSRFSENSLVTEDPMIKFYAGWPLIDPDGYALGTLCVIDRIPRKLTDLQTKALKLLSEEIVSLIIDRRKKEEADQFDKLILLSNDLVGIADPNAYFLKINPAFQKVLGWDENVLLSKSIFELIHPKDIESTKNELSKLSPEETTVNLTNRFLTSENKYKHIQWAISQEVGTNNLFAIGRDVSIIKLKEEKLKISESNFRSFFENSQGLMCTHDTEGKFLTVNTAGSKLLGYSINEILKLTLYDLVPKQHHIILKKYLRNIQTFGKAKGFMITTHKNGTLKTWMYNNVLANDVDGNKYIIGNSIDITESHVLEQDLIRTKKLLEQTSIIASVGGWEFDLEKNTIYWSETTKKIHEVSPDYLPNLETGIDFYKVGKSRSDIQEAMNNCINDGKAFDVELQIITAKGNEIWVRALGNAINKGGKCVKIRGAFQDIDKRKKTELALEINENKYRTFFNNSPVGISITKFRTSELIECNQSFLSISGYTETEYRDKNTQLIKNNSFGKDKSDIDKSLDTFGRYGPYEKEITHKDGSKIPVILNGVKFLGNAGEPLVYSTIENVSERKKNEQILAKERNRLRAFVKNAPAAVAMLDINMHYIAASNRWKEEYKIDYNRNIIGESHYTVFPNISNKWKNDHQICLKGELLKNDEDVWRPEGWSHDMYLKWELSPWYELNGDIGGVIMFTQDITEICMQREELKLAKITAEQANRAKSDFLANMSHEIRTPLNGVIGFTDLVLKTQLNETQFQYLSIINQSANSLLNIVTDILDFSKIEAGKMELDITKCNLTSIGIESLNIVKYHAQSKGLEILLDFPIDLNIMIWADSVRLKQILINLLSNAIKFTAKGEVKLKVAILKKFEDYATLRFEVKDTGIGIMPDKKSTIFEPFLQEDSSTTKKYGGTGLGLSISNKLLEFMGSKMELISTPGKGSTFYFDIDLKYEDREAIFHESIDHIKNVLIVDDNENNRLILKNMLNLKSITSIEAKNGLDALQILSEDEFQFDVIIMDYHMPYMDGLESIKKIRENFDHHETELPIILLHSSSDDEKIIKLSKELRINQRLIKPITINQLFNSLSHLAEEEKDDEVSVIVKENTGEMKVLIVEDNVINSLLAKSIINRIAPNAIVNEASNGLKAVDYCESNISDIIFMDIQMPEMNGYEATMAIRQLPHFKSTPIIALTAGNVKGEKEKCLKAGMSDFLSKPIIENDIRGILKKWITVSDNFTDEDTDLKPFVNKAANFDVNILKNYVGDEPELIKEILQETILQLNKSLKLLSNLMDDEDLSSLKSFGHKLYGSASSVGLQNLALLCRKLENVELFSTETFELILETKTEVETDIQIIKEYLDNH